jgi:uncharacterized membrane protein HdeD (DUF308 family)
MKGGGWGEAILGILAIIFGIVLLANPLIGAVYLPYVLGIFALIGGFGAIISAFLLRPKT